MRYSIIILFLAPMAYADRGAVIKAVKKADIIYAQNYVLSETQITYSPCNSKRELTLPRNEYVVMESENVCTATHFLSQIDFLNFLAVKLARDSSISKINVSFPNLKQNDAEDALKGLEKEFLGRATFQSGNRFEVQVFMAPSDLVKTDEDAMKVFGNSHPDIDRDFLKVTAQVAH